jgi:CubicO group peptidase (beta-lactamase class C family)
MKTILYLIIFSLMQINCSNDFKGGYPYLPPENINDGLSTGTLEEVKIDTQMILKAVGRIQEGKYGEVHSMLIYKDNKLVFEEYFRGHRYQWDAPNYYGQEIQWGKNQLHQVMSCTKSFTSACIGIAIEKGFIQSVHQSIFDYLPRHQEFNTGEKSTITIEHLLTMTSGLQWNEWNAPHGTSANDADRLYFECYNDPVYCVLQRPLVSTPGESFTYNGGGIITLGEILRNATGMDLIEFSKKYLFDPMGIDSLQWETFPNGETGAAAGLHLRPRDMLKLGVTYLNGGIWNGERILPEDWVKKSSSVYRNNVGINIPIEDSGRNGYGYTWWISEVGNRGKKTSMYRANGWGGQVIMVLPEKDMVVVFTGGNYASRSSLFKILERFILPSSG